MRSRRLVHYLALAAVHGLLTLPNLDAASLWDMDEGVNAECAREMMEAGTWVVPTFNWELRTAKPVFLYWVQRLSFEAFGVSEWSARLPAVLFGLGSVLLTYELGRRMFDAATGLLAGIVLASAIQFCALSQAATPDAPLIFFTVLTFYLFWVGHEAGGRGWWVPTAAAAGLGALTKGPVAVGLPGLVVIIYFLWNREWRRILDRRLVWGALAFLAVAGPWYGFVASETRGEWAGKFFTDENLSRFAAAKEGHAGPPVYYLGAILVLFAPWSSMIGLTLWYGVKGARKSPSIAIDGLSPAVRAHRFLVCWFTLYLVFFSVAATKLPNYIAPLYPALALLTARYLAQWRNRELDPPRWLTAAGTACVALTGLLIVVVLLVGSGVISVKGVRTFPGVEWWAWIGLIPVAAAVAMGWLLRTGNRGGVVTAFAAGAVGMVGLIAAGVPPVIDRAKAAKVLVLTSGARQPDRDVRLAAVGYFQESLVFYAERRVWRGVPVEGVDPNGAPQTYLRPFTPDDVADLLALPLPVYVFVPEVVWAEQIAPRVTTPYRIAARKYDFYRNAEILVVTNESP